MNCILVDDEPMALELIKGYIAKTDSLKLQASFTNPFKALNYLLEHEVDLILLDINMPELNGMELLKALPYQPKVIFTTAYSAYGAESYEYNAVDYLLKPFTFDRFMRAVNKLFDTRAKNRLVHDNAEKHQTVIFIKSGTQIHQIEVDKITHIEAQGNYVFIHLKDKKIISLISLNEILEELPASGFMRIHKSYIVAIQHIDVIERHQVIIQNTSIPIGATYRALFHQQIEQLRSK
ncbi:MAG: response regulator transcription factor [Bacteroidales bacterium]|nr:response regulator transcription factor [Bacteroidales bacterium]